jgi:ferritin
MEIIKRISEKIDSELEDAEKYIKCAYKVEDEYPQLADTYYKLSLEEMKHVTMLHEEVVSIINDYKREHEIPAGMQVLYDYLHQRQIKWAAKIKAKQDEYK